MPNNRFRIVDLGLAGGLKSDGPDMHNYNADVLKPETRVFAVSMSVMILLSIPNRPEPTR